jgi:DNA repair exonuclease SbcCD nuclease subunit
LDFHILQDLLKKYDLLSADKLSVCIGNHDIFGGVHLATEILNYPQKCLETDYDNKVLEFGRFFQEAFTGTYRSAKDEYFPYAKDLGDIVIFGINSIARYSRIKNLFASNGKIYTDQYDQLEKLLSDSQFQGKTKIVIMHHHMNHGKNEDIQSTLWPIMEKHTMKMRKRKKLNRFFQKHNIQYVFHGHIHVNHDYLIDRVRYFNAGASLEYDLYKEIKLNLVTISPNSADFEIVALTEDKINIENVYIIDQLIPSFAS